ncbi:MAG: hypothetical protein ACYC6A_18495 [Armatimonadota bacterium]
MALRFGFVLGLIALYIAGWQLNAHQAPTWLLAALMGVVFIALVAAMYLRVLPALLALPILALALASIAGMKWDAILTTVVGEGSTRLSTAILAAIFGSILAQVVEKTGIAQTAIKKTAELGGDKPIFLAVLLTIVIALLFTTLGGLGAVIMVATIVIPILLSLGLRPLYVGCLFLMAMSLGGAFNLQNWALYKDALGLDNAQIGAFAWPFAGLMLVVTFAFLAIEGKRMGKARFKAEVTETEPAHQFVPWYALLTPIVPLIPVLVFTLLPKVWVKPAEAAFIDSTKPAATVTISRLYPMDVPPPTPTYPYQLGALVGPGARDQSFTPVKLQADEKAQLQAGYYLAEITQPDATSDELASTSPAMVVFKADPWTKFELQYSSTAAPSEHPLTISDATPTTFDFPIVAALLLGIIYGAITTWRRGQSTVQLLTKSSFDGVGAVGPALVLMIGIGMVLKATMAPEVSNIISPVIALIVPKGDTFGSIVHYVLLFGIFAPLALYRGPFNMWGMGAGLLAVLAAKMPGGALMGAFMSTGMIQGVSDPTNTHNVWIANYTNTDVQDIMKRTLPYMWVLAFVGLILSAVLYYGGVIK